MSNDKLITLVEWADRNGIKRDAARRKAWLGGFETARKLGHDWVIDEDEMPVDRRRLKDEGDAKQNTVEGGDNI